MKHDELVEETGRLFDEYERTCADGHYGQVELDQCRQDLSVQAITLILSAVRDGLELPDEVGRFDFHMKNWDTFEHWVAQALHDDADTFIALSGTSQGDPVGGKEEK